MAHSKSAKKRIRQNADHRLRNRRRKDALKTSVRVLDEAVQAGDAEKASEQLKEVYQRLDKTAAKGAVHARTAARIKSRLQRRLNKARASKQP